MIVRKALIIGSPGGITSKFLPGVKKDVQNLTRFLKSPRGGSWRHSEIMQLDNPTYRQLKTTIASAQADYLLVYFSGHGITNSFGQRMLALQDNLISDIELINDSPKQLIIIDACRDNVDSGLSGFPRIDDHVDNLDGGDYSYRLFNEYVALSPPGRMIVHATQPGSNSEDTSTGGIFSKALLHVASTLVSEGDYSPTGIKTILQYTPRAIKDFGGNQIPDVVYTEGNLTVPFAFSRTSNFLPDTTIRLSNSNTGAAIAFSFIALCIVIAIVSD